MPFWFQCPFMLRCSQQGYSAPFGVKKIGYPASRRHPVPLGRTECPLAFQNPSIIQCPLACKCPLAIQCPYIKSAPWPASAPWPSNAPLIRSTLSGYGAITGYSALLVSVPLHVTVPLQVTVPQTISVFFQVTVPPARLRCSFWCQYPFWYLIPPMVSLRTHAHTFN